MNSSRKISPGWTGAILPRDLVVIDDFDFIGIAISPFKTDSPLIVDADAVLTLSASTKSFEPISRRVEEIGQVRGSMQHQKFAICDLLDIGKAPVMPPLENGFGIFIPKRTDHA